MYHSVKVLLAFIIVLTMYNCENRKKPSQVASKEVKTAESAGDYATNRLIHKRLSMQNYVFELSTTGEGSIQQLEIQPYGLTIDTAKISMEIMGNVTDAEIEDLNSDGFPEILIYSTSAGSGSYGDVIGYSVNKGKSMSRITFPNITDNPEACKGYRGHDQFRIVENTLVQRFQLYNPSDVNARSTGNMRQIQYKLKDGESSRIFVIDKIVEYPAK